MNTSQNQATQKLRNLLHLIRFKTKPRHCRILALLLAIIMLFGVPLGTDLGITEVEASNIIDSGTWGSNINWEFDGNTLSFHGSGAMQDAPVTWVDYTYTIHTPWWNTMYEKRLKKVIIGEGITRVGDFNFTEIFPNLEAVSFPSTLTSIGKQAFIRCTSLKKIDFPKGLKTIGDFAFCDCISLSNITLPASITKIGESAFSGCNGFTSLVIPSSLKTINDSFTRCHNLTTVKISNGVTKIGDEAFTECYNLKTIDIPASVTNIGFRAFDDCKKLTSIKIRNRNCKISMKNELTIPTKATIYGYKNSPAQKYAKKFGNKFKTLSGSSNTSSKTVKAKTLKITGSPKKLKAGKSKTLKVKFTPSNVSSKKVTWKSSNKKYATVNSKGKVTAKKAGRGKTVKITATAKDGSKKKATVKIKIS